MGTGSTRTEADSAALESIQHTTSSQGSPEDMVGAHTSGVGRWSVPVRLAAMMFLQYFALGAWIVPLTRYLQTLPADGGLGFTPSQVGFIYMSSSTSASAAMRTAGSVGMPTCSMKTSCVAAVPPCMTPGVPRITEPRRACPASSKPAWKLGAPAHGFEMPIEAALPISA